MGGAVDFIPIAGDIKGIGEAIANPTPINIAAAAIGVSPVVGDVASKGLKSLDKAGIVYRRINNETGGCYIGRCNSQSLFERRQRDHARRNPDADYEFEIIERAEPGQP